MQQEPRPHKRKNLVLQPVTWSRGLVPWDVAGLREVEAFMQRLSQIPKDDWDLRDRITVMDTAGGEVVISRTQTDLVSQVHGFLMDHYDVDVYMAHVIRFRLIRRFLREHSERLSQERLICTDGTPCTSLAHALCVLPFNRRGNSDCEYDWEYDLTEVLAAAKEAGGRI
jgi:hypothetical protein